jgi:hypothetical protein
MKRSRKPRKANEREQAAPNREVSPKTEAAAQDMWMQIAAKIGIDIGKPLSSETEPASQVGKRFSQWFSESDDVTQRELLTAVYEVARALVGSDEADDLVKDVMTELMVSSSLHPSMFVGFAISKTHELAATNYWGRPPKNIRSLYENNSDVDVGESKKPGYTKDAPPSRPDDASQEGMGEHDLNIAVKKAKAENLARVKPRPKRRSWRHQLANYKALVQNVDLENPALPLEEQRRRANRLLTAYVRVQNVKQGFTDSNIQLTAARRIQKAAHRERKKALANAASTVALG